MIFKMNMKNRQNITKISAHSIDFPQVIGLMMPHSIYNNKCKELTTRNCLKMKSQKINSYKDTFISLNQNLHK